MEAPSAAEIASRLERATRSDLASSSFLDLRLSPSPSPSPSLPSLSDLLSQPLGPSDDDSLRCSHCQARLLRGPRALFCFACGAPASSSASVPRVSFLSSLAYQRLLDALQLQGLENDPEKPVEESWALQELDMGEQTMASSASPESSPLQLEITEEIDLGEKAVTSKNYSESSVLHSETLVHNMGSASGQSGKQDAALDYSAQLEGISLEDFFLSQKQSQDEATLNTVAATDKQSTRVDALESPPLNVHKDSFFWDPLTESIIPDGEDLWSGKQHDEGRKEDLDEDDPFSSWEGDFQSAAPAAECQTSENQLDDFLTQSSQQEESYGLFLNDSLRSHQGKYPEVNDPTMLISSERHQDAASQSTTELEDLFFGSAWQQNVPVTSAHGAIEETRTAGDVMADKTLTVDSLIHSESEWQEVDLLQSSASTQLKVAGLEEIKTSSLNNGSNRGGEDHFKNFDEALENQQQPSSHEKASEIVESLVDQLHDLSFMLADKLIIKAAGNGNIDRHLDDERTGKNILIRNFEFQPSD